MMAQQLRGQYPLSRVSAVLQVPRSTLYWAAQEPSAEEQAVRDQLVRLAADWPRYGYRRLTAQLRREGVVVNSKRVRRLMHEAGISSSPPKRRIRTTNSDHPYPRFPNLVLGLLVSRPDQIWVADITYVRLLDSFVYLAVLMDAWTRSIRGWALGRTLDQSLTLAALNRALQTRQPEIHHSDQGVQYAAIAYVERLQTAGVQISMAEVGAAWQNGYAERLMRTIKEEEVTLTEYPSFAEAYAHLGRFLDDVYQHKRIHSALGYLTPAEFEQQWLTLLATM
jgi:putative transposase